jgi:AAA+ superfamily predicted ATPase
MIAYDDFFVCLKIGKPYINWNEQMGEYMLLLDMACLVALEYRKGTADSAAKNPLKGFVVTNEEAEALFTGVILMPGREDIDIAEQRVLLKALRHIASREEASLKEGVFLPLEHIVKVFGLSSYEKFCTVMGLAIELDRKYEKVFGYLHDNVAEKLPTIGLAADVYRMFAGGGKDLDVLVPSSAFSKYILDGKQENDSLSRLSRPVRLNGKIYDFLTGKGFEDYSAHPCFRVEYPDELPELRMDREAQERIRSVLDNLAAKSRKDKTALFIYGPPGAGKRLQVRHAAVHLNMPLVWLDGAVLRKDFKKLEEHLKNVLRSSILYQGILCLYNFDALSADTEEEALAYYEEEILDKLADNVDVLFVLSSKEWKRSSGSSTYTFVNFRLELPDDAKRLELWRKLAEGQKLDAAVDLAELSNKFHFTTGVIEKALHEAVFEADTCADGIVDKDILYRACIQQSAHNIEKKATKVRPAFTWEDLILPEEQKRLLFDACNHIRYKHVVFNQWGFDKKLPYGRGLGIIFYGPPGTGKTMGAQVLANELRLEIYRIDLSQIVSKYIGETEKNLREIFDEASRTSAILFFDEADSLFGKRAEVKDAQDRYANLETSYLLQKMEEYEGITILATNLLQNFDEAYRRRFKFMINFPMPDVKNRRKLWENIFPQKLPMDPEVDLDFLANKFELSGSNIKNIAVAASFLAAGEGSPLKMMHLIKALKNEMTKAGKIIVKQDLGGYGDLF